jgi:hypothetical protein
MTLLTACLGDIPLVCSVLAELFSSVMWAEVLVALCFFSPQRCQSVGSVGERSAAEILRGLLPDVSTLLQNSGGDCLLLWVLSAFRKRTLQGHI